MRNPQETNWHLQTNVSGYPKEDKKCKEDSELSLTRPIPSKSHDLLKGYFLK